MEEVLAVFIGTLVGGPRGLLTVGGDLEEEAANPEGEAEVVACAQGWKDGGGEAVCGHDWEGDKCDPGGLGKEGDGKAGGLGCVSRSS